jgi:PIN like domain
MPSDTSQPPSEPAVLLLDQTFSSVKLAAILSAAPEWTIELHGKHFKGDAKDHEWVPVAASRGWLILSCDKRIRKWRTENGLARRAAIESAAKVFFLARGSRPFAEYGYIVGRARNSILRLAKKNRGGPLFARILSNGTVEALYMDNLTKRDKTRQKFGNVING